MLCFIHIHQLFWEYCCMFMCAFLAESFLYFLFSMKVSIKNLLLKNNTEGLLLVKENTDKEVFHEEIYSKEF